MITIKYGEGQFDGPGVRIELDGDDVATAIITYLTAHDIHIDGPRTITVNGELCKKGSIYVDPSGNVYYDGDRISGRGPKNENS